MSPSIQEETVEDAACQWFELLGYDILHGPDIAPGEPAAERTDFGEVVLGNRLSAALERLNTNVPDSALDEALRKVTRTETPSLVESLVETQR
jgi:type I restriction enzyme R subunit